MCFQRICSQSSRIREFVVKYTFSSILLSTLSCHRCCGLNRIITEVVANPSCPRCCGQCRLVIDVVVNAVLSSMLWSMLLQSCHRCCGQCRLVIDAVVNVVLSSMLRSIPSCHRCCGQCRLVIEVVLNSSLSQQLRSILSSHQIQSALDLFCGHNQIPRKHDRPCKASYPQQSWY